MLASDPMDYFNKHTGCELEESLLLRFLYHPGEKALDLVVCYSAEVVSRAFAFQLQGREPVIEPRDLRHFRMLEVSMINVEGEQPDSPLAWRQYEKQVLARPQVLTGVKHARAEDGFLLSFVLSRFGRHVVCYKSFLVEARCADARAVSANQWQYFDHASGELVEFSNPFPWIDSEVNNKFPALQSAI